MPEVPQMLFLWFSDGLTGGVLTVPAGTFNEDNPYPEAITIRYKLPNGSTVPIVFRQDARHADRYESIHPCPYPKLVT